MNGRDIKIGEVEDKGFKVDPETRKSQEFNRKRTRSVNRLKMEVNGLESKT